MNLSLASIKKTFPEMGEIEYKIASSREEFEQSCALVYREYLKRGFILPKYYKSGLRITMHHIVPGMTTFIALKDKQVVATVTIIPDSPLGLPMDMGYKEEADKFRNMGRAICEVGYLAINSDVFGRGLFSMFNFKKLDFMFTLFRMVMQYVVSRERYDDICIVTNPKYMIFKFIPFDIIGKAKYYGYDRMAIKKKAAVAKRMDLKRMRENFDNPGLVFGARITIYKMFFGSKVPAGIFENKYKLSPEDLNYFFVKKSDILKKLRKDEKEYIKEAHNLTEEEFDSLLKGRG